MSSTPLQSPAPEKQEGPAQAGGTRSRPPALEVTELRKTFRGRDGRAVPAVDGISLTIEPGEIVVLLGPSGCGKTTLLRCVAGLEQPEGGTIAVAGNTVFSADSRQNLPPEKRSLSMMFQSYALWPHMTAYENVAYPLRTRKVPDAEIKDRVMHALETVSIPHLVGEYPSTMSGGQQQRVALARALVAGTGLILFDEPLSNVDAKIREDLRNEIKRMQEEFSFAGLYVTHDQAEALSLGDRIAVLNEGRAVEVGTAREVYHRPRELYTSQFVGVTNEILGSPREEASGAVAVATSLGTIWGNPSASESQLREDVIATFRPECCSVSAGPAAASTTNQWVGTVTSTTFAGAHLELIVDVDGTALRAWAHSREVFENGQQVTLSVEPNDVRLFPARRTEADR